jgi:hypothetical protein
MSRGYFKTILSKIPFVLLPLGLGIMYIATHETNSSVVIKEIGKTYIIDRTGERWDVTRAVSLGFDPEGFEFGLGRNAFIPLDDSFLTENSAGVSSNTRVIGIADGSRAQAYTIGRLIGHEVANSNLGAQPVAVSY